MPFLQALLARESVNKESVDATRDVGKVSAVNTVSLRAADFL
jgi:hypothetical protein